MSPSSLRRRTARTSRLNSGTARPERRPPPGGGEGPARPERIGPHGQISRVRTPRLILRRPAQPNGAAVIVVGSGGYHSIELGQESGPAARWLNAQGVTAFELVYRLPAEGWPSNATF